eukprot:3075178-Prorocentrum_lima.AAC.1
MQPCMYTNPGPKKALDQRGQMGKLLYCQSWSNQVTYVLATDSKGRSQVITSEAWIASHTAPAT